MIRIAYALLLLASCLGCSVRTAPPISPSISPALDIQPDTLRTYDGKVYPVELGSFSVPLDHRNHGQQNITLRFLRLRSTANKPGPPVVFLMGGPGIPATAMAAVPPYNSLFQRLRETADVILLDQRGLGRSSPVLQCSPQGDLPANGLVARRELLRLLTERTAACAKEWSDKGFAPQFFSTAQSADDIEHLRRALSVQQLDLLAFSYGTRLALSTVGRHPHAINRMVLASVNGPDNALKLPSTFDDKLRAIAALAESDPLLDAKPGEVLGALGSFQSRLAVEPVTVEVPGGNGQVRAISVGIDGFNAIVSMNLDNPRLPAMLLSLGRGDDAIFRGMAANAAQGFSTSSTSLMARAMNCSALRSKTRLRQIENETQASLIGDPVDNWFLTDDYCAAIGRFDRPADREFTGPIKTDVPVLFLSGSLDGNTPPSNVARIESGFTRAITLSIENGQHETLPISAVQDLVVDFFAGRSVSSQRISISPPRFMTIEAAKAPAPPRR